MYYYKLRLSSNKLCCNSSPLHKTYIPAESNLLALILNFRIL